MNDSHDLRLIIESRIPVIVIETWEEKRALTLLSKLGIQLGYGAAITIKPLISPLPPSPKRRSNIFAAANSRVFIRSVISILF